jgi:endonuclease-8
MVDDNKHHGALFRFKVFHRDGEVRALRRDD